MVLRFGKRFIKGPPSYFAGDKARVREEIEWDRIFREPTDISESLQRKGTVLPFVPAPLSLWRHRREVELARAKSSS